MFRGMRSRTAAAVSAAALAPAPSPAGRAGAATAIESIIIVPVLHPALRGPSARQYIPFAAPQDPHHCPWPQGALRPLGTSLEHNADGPQDFNSLARSVPLPEHDDVEAQGGDRVHGEDWIRLALDRHMRTQERLEHRRRSRSRRVVNDLVAMRLDELESAVQRLERKMSHWDRWWRFWNPLWQGLWRRFWWTAEEQPHAIPVPM